VSTPVSSMVLVFVASLIGSMGAACLKSGAQRLRFSLAHLLRNYYLALGVGLFLLSSYFFVLGLRRGELTILYPLVSLNYIWTLLWARIFFHEPFTRAKLMGLGLILLGVAFIGWGNR
jgi:drug/metabolite transporter (DMT)-like permease